MPSPKRHFFVDHYRNCYLKTANINVKYVKFKSGVKDDKAYVKFVSRPTRNDSALRTA